MKPRYLVNLPSPEKTYIDLILPAKISLNMRYIENKGVKEYFRILMGTFKQLTMKSGKPLCLRYHYKTLSGNCASQLHVNNTYRV